MIHAKNDAHISLYELTTKILVTSVVAIYGFGVLWYTTLSSVVDTVLAVTLAFRLTFSIRLGYKAWKLGLSFAAYAAIIIDQVIDFLSVKESITQLIHSGTGILIAALFSAFFFDLVQLFREYSVTSRDEKASKY